MNEVQPYMEQFFVARYLHSTGMPAAFDVAKTDLEVVKRLALAHSKEHADDWVRVKQHRVES
jgi:hypothetical protein